VLVKPDANPRKYESLRKANNALLKNIRLRAAESDKYRQLENALSETACAQESENTPPVLLVDQDRCKKKRKVLKAFREYTNPKDTEGKFKGWSTRAANDMRDAILKLKRVDNKDLLFRRVYRHIYKEEKGGAKKKKRVQEQECPDNYEEDMWGLAAEVTPV
jgi:hypothetical protein